MRKEIFLAIARQLSQIQEIAYVDLWNSNIDEVEAGSLWPLPAVFVEFEAIEWQHTGLGHRKGEVAIRLHVIQRAMTYNGSQDERMQAALERFDIIERINNALYGLGGDGFASIMLTTSATNHNHAELIEDIERYITAAKL